VHWEQLFARGQYDRIRDESVADLEALGRFDIRGRMTGVVRSSMFALDTQCFHLAEEAHAIVPLAYHHLALVNHRSGRYLDAAHCANESVRQGTVFYGTTRGRPCGC